MTRIYGLFDALHGCACASTVFCLSSAGTGASQWMKWLHYKRLCACSEQCIELDCKWRAAHCTPLFRKSKMKKKTTSKVCSGHNRLVINVCSEHMPSSIIHLFTRSLAERIWAGGESTSRHKWRRTDARTLSIVPNIKLLRHFFLSFHCVVYCLVWCLTKQKIVHT